MERITIKSAEKKENIYVIRVETGLPTHYYKNQRLEINGEHYRVLKVEDAMYLNGQRKYYLVAYKRPQIGKINYNSVPFEQIFSFTREDALTNLITLGNRSEMRYSFDTKEEALAEFNILRQIIQEEKTYPWIKLI